MAAIAMNKVSEIQKSFSNSKLTPFTYQLNHESSDSKWFYLDLSNFTDIFLPILEESQGSITDKYITFIKDNNIENLRTKNEYLIEPLILGALWNCYINQAIESNPIVVKSASYLYSIRNKNTFVKRYADNLRGHLLTYIINESKAKETEYSLKNLEKLFQWLEASGDFKQELTRFQHWTTFLRSLQPSEQSFILECISQIAKSFQYKSMVHLGFYTQQVEAFRKDVPINNKNNENRIFCGRHRVEYHLNMFAAEVLNRQFKEEFDKTSHKVVLLPTCMRRNSSNCKAKNNNGKITCQHCSKNCNIHNIVTSLAAHNVQTFLIPHSSNFSKFLKQWENNKDIGLIGVACVLNLLTGGYEMKGFNIAAQCVFLNYSGCQKHWHPSGISTQIDIQQLYKTLNIP